MYLENGAPAISSPHPSEIPTGLSPEEYIGYWDDDNLEWVRGPWSRWVDMGPTWSYCRLVARLNACFSWEACGYRGVDSKFVVDDPRTDLYGIIEQIAERAVDCPP